jgi:hypothetical protein
LGITLLAAIATLPKAGDVVAADIAPSQPEIANRNSDIPPSVPLTAPLTVPITFPLSYPLSFPLSSVISGPLSSPLSVPISAAISPQLYAVQISWNMPKQPSFPIAGYNVYRYSEHGPAVKLNDRLLTVTSYIDDQVVAGMIYYYDIRAVDRNGNLSPFYFAPQQFAVCNYVSRLAISPSQPADLLLKIRQTRQFSIVAYDPNGRRVPYTPTWAVQPSDIASIDKNGNIKTLSPGQGAIVAYDTKSGALSSVIITVTAR